MKTILSSHFKFQARTISYVLLIRCLVLLILICEIQPSYLMSSEMSPIHYSLSFEAAPNHYLDVEAIYPTDGKSELELMMAVWTPGSYLVREYARHVEDLKVTTLNGDPLSFEKSRKNRWVVETSGNKHVRVNYRIYCRELTVRSNWVGSDFAILNGASTFITLVGGLDREHIIELRLPDNWEHSITGLPDHLENKSHTYQAKNFDTLVDSPIFAGNPAVYEFEVDGKTHLLVNQGEDGVWDGPRSARDVEAIVRQNLDFWGSLPYEKYVFLNMIVGAGGGLEHKNSTLMMTNRWTSRDPEQYRKWLGLTCHEFFHTWNVKRLRPVELGPFDYEKETYTKSLWIVEGLTSYYDDLLLRRAGLLTTKQYLEALSANIKRVQETPGRRASSLEQSSFDAWIKFYRPDENSVNSTISYYTKGALIGFLLDAHLRNASSGRINLDQVMLSAMDNYSSDTGYTSEEFKETVSKLAGIDLRSWFKNALQETGELDYTEALDLYGLEFEKPLSTPDEDIKTPSLPGWVGVTTKNKDGRLIVKQVLRGSPAYQSGVNVDDEILALNGFRVTHKSFKKRLKQYLPEEKLTVLVSRRERLLDLHLILGTAPQNSWKLRVKEGPSPSQKESLRHWLGVTARD